MIETNCIEVNCQGADVLPIDRIMEFQGKLKKLSEKNRERLKASILKHGFISPFFVWDDAGEYKLLDGHQRLATLLYMREKEGYDLPLFPVVYVHAETVEDAKRKLLQITSQYGEFTTEGFAEFTEGFDFDAEEFRIVDGEFDLKFLQDEQETTGDDDAPEVQEESVSKLGEIYELGEHRLMCGDSTDAEQVARLMGGELADLWITDPPYNVEYVGKTKDALKIQNDKQTDVGFRTFLVDAFMASTAVLKPGAAFYIWHADSEGFNFRYACKEAGLEVRQCLVWNKNSMVMGRQDYQWKHEPCLYGWKDGASHLWASDRKQTTVIDYQKPHRSAEHPTMKPVGLFEYQILNNTKGKDIVLDTFGGSGTTIIASAKNDRRCRMMELDPIYCDVIRRRWTKWATENGKEVGSGKLI